MRRDVVPRHVLWLVLISAVAYAACATVELTPEEIRSVGIADLRARAGQGDFTAQVTLGDLYAEWLTRALLGLLDDDTAFHDEDDVFQQTDVIKRVAIDSDQVCQEPWLYGANLVLEAEQLGRNGRGRLDCLHR